MVTNAWFFAAERTLLAWIRTGLTVMAFGFLVARFGLFLRIAAAQLGARGVPTYQWSARHHMQGNLMVVEGQIKTDKGNVPITCKAATGARERHVSVQVGQ